MTDANLALILVNRHSGLATKLLAQHAFTARFPIAEDIQRKRTLQTGGQRGNQFIQQRFAGGRWQRVGRIAMTLQRHHQLAKEQLRHVVGDRIVLVTFMLKLAYHLARLRHTHTTQSPVRLSRCAVKTRDRALPAQIQL